MSKKSQPGPALAAYEKKIERLAWRLAMLVRETEHAAARRILQEMRDRLAALLCVMPEPFSDAARVAESDGSQGAGFRAVQTVLSPSEVQELLSYGPSGPGKHAVSGRGSSRMPAG